MDLLDAQVPAFDVAAQRQPSGEDHLRVRSALVEEQDVPGAEGGELLLREGARALTKRGRNGQCGDTVRELRDMVRNLKRFSRTAAETPNALILGASPEGRK